MSKVLLFGMVAIVAVALIVYFGRSGGGGAAATQPVALAPDAADVQRAQGVSMGGEENAPVLLYEFADFQCPACAQFSTFAHPLIKERLVDTGIVHFVRYDFPLVRAHPHAFLAGRAARCAGDQGQYWEYHDVLYGRQPTWSGERNPISTYESYAEMLGLDARQFSNCLRSDQHAEEVTRNLQLGESLGVNGTPTLFLNGERVQVRDYNELEQRVLEAAGRADAPAGAAG